MVRECKFDVGHFIWRFCNIENARRLFHQQKITDLILISFLLVELY